MKYHKALCKRVFIATLRTQKREEGVAVANEVEMQQIHDFLEECVNEETTFYLTTVDK